ncbi:glycosyltransferase family 4 protein [bacterium]|nr:glycosyltransferase family 4 protein [bacterium]
MKNEKKKPKLLFWGLMGYDRPSTRVRCVNFANQLRKRDYSCDYMLMRDKYGKQFGHEQMLHIGDWHKLAITIKAYRDHRDIEDRILFLQKAHWHAVAPHLLHKRRGVKMIFDYDDWDLDRSPFFNHETLNRIFMGSRDEVVNTWKLVDESLACVAASKGLETLLKKRHSLVYYIPTGPNADLFCPTESQLEARKSMDKTIFTWCGNVWGGVLLGNVTYLLNCFSKVYEANPNVELRLLAWGTYGQVVKELISTAYDHLPIRFNSFIPPDQVPNYMAGAHVGLLPLKGDDMNLEWLKGKSPTKQFEYMAMQMATVATPIGDVKHLVKDGENGFLAPTQNDFVEKMLKLAGDRSLCAKMGERARQTILDDYCLERLGDKLVFMLNDLMKKGVI